jgi:hypothetical protein
MKSEQKPNNEPLHIDKTSSHTCTKRNVSGSLSADSMEWFFAKNEIEKHDLKDKHFNTVPIQHSSQWGFHFTFGQIEEMYKKENNV